MWKNLLVGLCLAMIIEGIWPFLDPAGMRRFMRKFADQDEQSLRIIGFTSMVTGVMLLYLIN